MNTAYVSTSYLFYQGAGFIDWAVRQAERDAGRAGRFCHVACRVSQTEIIDATVKGVRKRTIDPMGLDAGAIEVPHPLNVLWLEAQLGKPYDYDSLAVDLLTDVLPGWIEVYVSRQSAFDCSRLGAIAGGYGQSGTVRPWTPQGLYNASTSALLYNSPILSSQ